MRFFGKLMAVTSLFVVAGCSTLSSMNPFAKAETKNVPATLQEFKSSISIKSVWTASVGASGSFVFSPVQIENAVVAAAADGNLVKIDLAKGNVVWRINAGTSLTGGVGADATTIAVAGAKGMLMAFDLRYFQLEQFDQ